MEAVFFSRAAVVTFGGAYAVLAYVAQQAVEVFGWLSPQEMIDGLALAETTPGPLIQVVQFVGFLGAYRTPGFLDPMGMAVIGSVVTTWVTFVPCFLFIFAGAPWVEEIQHHPRVQKALAGITAAVVGVVANLALWFAIHTVFRATRAYETGPLELELPVWSAVDPAAAVIAGAIMALALGTKASMFVLLGAGVVLGVLLSP